MPSAYHFKTGSGKNFYLQGYQGRYIDPTAAAEGRTEIITGTPDNNIVSKAWGAGGSPVEYPPRNVIPTRHDSGEDNHIHLGGSVQCDFRLTPSRIVRQGHHASSDDHSSFGSVTYGLVGGDVGGVTRDQLRYPFYGQGYGESFGLPGLNHFAADYGNYNQRSTHDSWAGKSWYLVIHGLKVTAAASAINILKSQGARLNISIDQVYNGWYKSPNRERSWQMLTDKVVIPQINTHREDWATGSFTFPDILIFTARPTGDSHISGSETVLPDHITNSSLSAVTRVYGSIWVVGRTADITDPLLGTWSVDNILMLDDLDPASDEFEGFVHIGVHNHIPVVVPGTPIEPPEEPDDDDDGFTDYELYLDWFNRLNPGALLMWDSVSETWITSSEIDTRQAIAAEDLAAEITKENLRRQAANDKIFAEQARLQGRAEVFARQQTAYRTAEARINAQDALEQARLEAEGKAEEGESQLRTAAGEGTVDEGTVNLAKGIWNKAVKYGWPVAKAVGGIWDQYVLDNLIGPANPAVYIPAYIGSQALAFGADQLAELDAFQGPVSGPVLDGVAEYMRTPEGHEMVQKMAVNALLFKGAGGVGLAAKIGKGVKLVSGVGSTAAGVIGTGVVASEAGKAFVDEAITDARRTLEENGIGDMGNLEEMAELTDEEIQKHIDQYTTDVLEYLGEEADKLNEQIQEMLVGPLGLLMMWGNKRAYTIYGRGKNGDKKTSKCCDCCGQAASGEGAADTGTAGEGEGEGGDSE